MASIETVMDSVVDALKGITQSNGFNTDLGTILNTGWPKQLLLGEQQDPPIATVHPATESTLDSRGGVHRVQRETVVEILFDPQQSSQKQVDLWVADIRSALVSIDDKTAPISDFALGNAEWNQLDGESSVVQLAFPFTITYVQGS